MTDNDMVTEYASSTEESTSDEQAPYSPEEIEFINHINNDFAAWKKYVSEAFERLNAQKDAKTIYLSHELDGEFRVLYTCARNYIRSVDIYASRGQIRHELTDEATSRIKAIKAYLQKARKEYKTVADAILDEIQICKQDEAFLQKMRIIVQDELNQGSSKSISSKTVEKYVDTIIRDFAYPSEELIRTWVKKNKRSFGLNSIYEVFEIK